MSPKEAHELFSELGRASKALELYTGVSRNSATFARTATNEAVERMNEPGVLGLVKEGSPVQALKRGVQTVMGATPADKIARNDETYRQLAEALTSYRGPQAADAMRKLTDAYQVGPANKATSAAIGANLGAGSGLSLYQLGTPLLERRNRQ